MNKRGVELMGKTIVEIIIAVIVVGILFYASYVLFRNYLGNQQESQATGLLENIKDAIDSANLNEEKTISMLAPKAWHLLSFDEANNFNGNFEKPDIYYMRNCLCICKDKKCKICTGIEFPAKTGETLVDIIIPEDISIVKTDKDIKIQKKV